MDTDSDTGYWTSDDQENPQDAQSTDESESEFEDDVDSDLDDLENNDGDEIQRDLRDVLQENGFIGSQLTNLHRENQRFTNMLEVMQNGDRLRRRRVLEVGLIFYRSEVDINDDIDEQEQILNRYPAPPPQSGETPNPTTVLIHNTAQQNIDMLQQILLLRQDTDAIRRRIREFRSRQRLRL